METLKSSFKLVVGIVTYNPDIQTLQRIKMLLDNGFDFLVVDNTPGDDFWPMQLRSRVIRDGKNWGLGFGLKKLGEWAVNQKYTHLLYFDQDVIFTVDSLAWICRWYGHHQPKESVGLIWFNYQNKGLISPEFSEPYTINLAISAGSFINLKALDAIGGHTDRWFLEGIDYDFCFRLVQNEYHLLGVDHCPGIDYLANQPGVIRIDNMGNSHLLRIQPMKRLWNFWSVLLDLTWRALWDGPRKYAYIFSRNILTYGYDQLNSIFWTYWIKLWKK